MPTAYLQRPIPPYSHVCTPATRLQTSSLQTSIRPRHYGCCAPLDLQSSIPLRDNAPASYPQNSIHLYIHLCTTAACIQCSMPPHLHASTSACPQRASRTSYLHVYRPAAHPPELHISVISQGSMWFRLVLDNCETLRRFFYAPYRVFLSLINRNCCCI